jgi:hypothetical protein
MSLSLNRIVSILAERSGRTFDIPFQRELKDMVHYYRGTILKRSLEKNALTRRNFIQSLVLEVEKAPKVECPIEFGCIYRTKEILPKPIRSNNILFDFVGSADMEIAVPPSQEYNITFLKHSKYTGKSPRYVYKNDRIYLYNFDEIQYIGIQGVFDDAKLLEDLKCNGKACLADDDPYPLSNDLIQQVIEAILKIELRLLPREEETEVEVNQEDKTDG